MMLHFGLQLFSHMNHNIKDRQKQKQNDMKETHHFFAQPVGTLTSLKDVWHCVPAPKFIYFVGQIESTKIFMVAKKE